jgi:uncharacterized protein involved in oxidation of intracellular sulfur
VNALFILNDPPYGTERSYNALRLGRTLAKREDVSVRAFLMGDAVGCAVVGQVLPNGYYNLERLIGSAVKRGAEVGLCGTCMDARGISDSHLVEGAHRSTIDELTEWTVWADKVLTF